MEQEKSSVVTMKKNNRKGSISSMFMHTDGVDFLLMIFGFIGSVGDGLITLLVLFITSCLMINIGTGSSAVSLSDSFLNSINETRTGERQAARMRARYLKAVLRQDVGYFDLHVTSTSEVITCVSNESLVIQDVLGEKLFD